MSEIYTFSQHIFQNRAYRLTFFWLFEDTPTRNHPFSSQNERQQQNKPSGVPSFCLDRTQIYMKSEHLAEAKRKWRSRSLPTIINYKDTITFNNNNLYEWSGSSFEFEPTELRLHPSLGKVFNSRFGSAHTPKPTLYHVRIPHFVELWHERYRILRQTLREEIPSPIWQL